MKHDYYGYSYEMKQYRSSENSQHIEGVVLYNKNYSKENIVIKNIDDKILD